MFVELVSLILIGHLSHINCTFVHWHWLYPAQNWATGIFSIINVTWHNPLHSMFQIWNIFVDSNFLNCPLLLQCLLLWIYFLDHHLNKCLIMFLKFYFILLICIVTISSLAHTFVGVGKHLLVHVKEMLTEWIYMCTLLNLTLMHCAVNKVDSLYMRIK